jgi:hypothetical protein
MNQELQDLILDVREQVLYLQELGVEELDAKLRERLAAVPQVNTEPVRPNLSSTVEMPKAEVRPPRPAAARPEGYVPRDVSGYPNCRRSRAGPKPRR